MTISAHDPRHRAAYRAVLDYCSHGIQGIGPFEAEEIVRLVERAFNGGDEGAVERAAQAIDDAAMGALDGVRNENPEALREWARAALRAAGGG